MRRSATHLKFGYWLEQGLGKTALVLNDYVDRFTEFDTAFVVCPNTFKIDWTTAPAEWGLDFSTSLWPKEAFRTGTYSKPHFNVINIEAVRQSGYEVVKGFLDKRPCVMIVDESSLIKNFKSQSARAVLDLCKRARVVRLLNGTPLTQNVMDLFPQLKCLGELDGMNPYVFRNRFAKVGGYMGKQIVGIQNEDQLIRIQERCSFRALKEDWVDIPPKIPVPLRLEMTNNQRKHYKEMYETFITMVRGHEFDASMVLTQMDKLRQITSGILIDGEKHELIDPPDKNPKIKAAAEIVEIGAGKMIISHMYTKMGQVIVDEMSRRGFQPAVIRGGMKPEELAAEKLRFNNDHRCRVLVGQIQAASKGHTLLGGRGTDRCNATFYHDHTFSLLDRSQMDDRNHRGEQDQNVNIYEPIMSPIDETQMKALHNKQNLADLVINSIRSRPDQYDPRPDAVRRTT